ncbi:YncE family protein [Ottowia sp.]|uniref:YncE family protein n=1 Tax=Ottowia sp. TaxID=1898956 RepID=UPI003A8536D2
MLSSRIFLLSAVAAAAFLVGCAQSGPTASSPSVATAVATKQEVQRKALAKGIYELVYSPRQKAVFVASTGGFGDEAEASKVLRLDPATLTVQSEIVLPTKGFGLTLDDAAGRLYVGHSVDGAVSVVDVAAGKVISTVQLTKKTKDDKGRDRPDHGLRELALDSANGRLYLPGYAREDSALYVMNTKTLKLEKVLPGFGSMATGVALDAQRGRLFVANLAGQVFTVDTRTLQIAKRYDVGGDQPLNLAYDAATDRLLAVNREVSGRGLEARKKANPNFQPKPGNNVLVLNASTGAPVHSMATGAGPVALKLDATRKRLYVTNRDAGSVTVYDSGSYQQLSSVDLPTHPNSLALDEAANVVFVSIKNNRQAPKGSNESVARLAF